MHKRIGIVLFSIALLFIANAIFGRYLVLPGYLQSLEAGLSGTAVPQDVPLDKVLRYLLWTYSFKLGVFFAVLGALAFHRHPRASKIIFASVSLAYIAIAYMDLPFRQPLFFGIGGGVITASVLVLLFCSNGRSEKVGKGGLLQTFGFFFLAMAAYNLCPFVGVKCFALEPDKMIRYGLQESAASFANHILLELAAGFCCLAAHHLVRMRKPSAV
jgi:hypothetical protein